MRVRKVFANLTVSDIGKARDFYADYLGLSSESLNLGWVARFETPDGKAAVQLVTRDASATEASVISVAVGADIDVAYAEAKRHRYEIVHPLTAETWGIRRFFVRAPDGTVINMTSHSD
ncbi:MAG: VOC family protein [Candidatus Dormibacteraceae bacterium]